MKHTPHCGAGPTEGSSAVCFCLLLKGQGFPRVSCSPAGLGPCKYDRYPGAGIYSCYKLASGPTGHSGRVSVLASTSSGLVAETLCADSPSHATRFSPWMRSKTFVQLLLPGTALLPFCRGIPFLFSVGPGHHAGWSLAFGSPNWPPLSNCTRGRCSRQS